jgi:hypothetical protein
MMTAEQAHATLAEVAEEIRQAQIARLSGKRVSVAGITDRVDSEAS